MVLSDHRVVFSYKLRYIVGFGLVEMAISTNPKPTIYRNLYENTSPGSINRVTCLYHMDVEAIVGICQSAL